MPQELIQLDARKRSTKIALILLLVIATSVSYFAFRWYIGNTMAEYFNTADNNLQLAQVASTLAPNDPLTHWRLAQVSQQRLPLDQVSVALSEYERAASLSPNDYRFWVALGVAREQSGDIPGGEQALRQAVALAPAYANPRWYLGNLLLRSGRYDEALAQLRTASEADPEGLRTQLFNVIWQLYSTDFEGMQKAIGSKPETRAQFSLHLLEQNRFDEGLRMWESLSPDEKKANKPTGESVLAKLISNLRFHDALRIWNELVPGPAYRVDEGRITDGGFEDQIAYSPEIIFGWQVKNVLQMEIGIDPTVSHNGSRSLRLTFQVRAQLAGISATQLIPVAKGAEYEFECFVKTSKLQSGGPPVIEIVDAATGAALATSEAAPSGDSDWNRIGLSFKTTDKTEAVSLRITRAACEDPTLCPIFGTIWYDDFSIKRRN
jgi:tetratricopeptide (TPR) repeat protein